MSFDLPPASMPLSAESKPDKTRRRRWPSIVWLVAAAAVGLAAAAVLTGWPPIPTAPHGLTRGSQREAPSATDAAAVRVVHPKRDPSLALTVDQLAMVEAYYRADLRARVSGLVSLVTKDIGDHVSKGELLILIDVPELEQDVAQKRAAVAQRQQEVQVARALVDDARAKKDVAAAAFRQRQAEAQSAEATVEFRRRRLERFRTLAARETISPDVLEEQQKELKSAEAAYQAALAGIERGQADLREADARIAAAAADIDLKSAIVEVARRDLARAQSVAGYTRITAPFDGVIIRRTVDPGSFVQNATSGSSEELISVARTDMVTIAARFSDAAAPFVTRETEAEITMSNLPGWTLHGRVTRFAPSVQNTDRTMRVEVDLFTGTEAEYRRLVSERVAATFAPMLAPLSWPLLSMHGCSQSCSAGAVKGDHDAVPPRPARPSDSGPMHILPGMTGTMRLHLRDFGDQFVVPSSAVYSRGGRPYVLLVENGLTREYPVEVQLNDQRVAKILIVRPKTSANGAGHEQSVELTGRELIVVARQVEIGDRRAVQPRAVDW